jgi:F-type H+-transporting ATPase subunit a
MWGAPMIASPLETSIWFSIGPVTITGPVVVTWGIMVSLTLVSYIVTRDLRLEPSRLQAVLELIVDTLLGQIRETMRIEPQPFLRLIGGLFVFILIANWSSLIPGVEPPTAHIETDAALALIVFLAVIYYGVRTRGLRGYLRTFAEPTIFMVPLNFVETFTRTFSLIVRLFGNVMSGVFIIGIIMSLAGLIVPIPLMALEVLTGAIQAYIFTVLAMVFISSAINQRQAKDSQERKQP